MSTTALPASDAAVAQQASPRPRRADRYTPAWTWASIAVAFACYTTWSVSRYLRYSVPSYDLSIFSQAINAYGHFRAPYSQVKGVNLLGDHFSPAIALLAPFYRLFPTPVTLLVAQAALLAIAALPIWRLAQRTLGTGPGAAIGVAYLIAWGTQDAINVDFHEVSLAVPLLGFALEAVVTKRPLWVIWAWSAPLVLVKEDLGLTCAALGIVLFLRGRRKGLWLGLYGVLAFALTVGVLIPAVNPRHRYDYWAQDASHSHSATPWVRQLVDLPHHLTSPHAKLITLFLLGVITGFACLRSTITLLAVPTIAWRFLADNPSYWGHDWHYDVVLMPILFAATIDAIHSGARSRRPWMRAYSAHVPAVCFTVGLLLCGQFPLRALVHSSTYRPATNSAAYRRAIDAIPHGASVETDIGIISELVPHHVVYWVGTAHNPPPDYELVTAIGNWSPAPPADVAAYAESIHPGTTYRNLSAGPGVGLAVRIG